MINTISRFLKNFGFNMIVVWTFIGYFLTVIVWLLSVIQTSDLRLWKEVFQNIFNRSPGKIPETH